MELLDQIASNPQLTPNQKEVAARKMGFRTYEEMILFEKQRQNKTGGTVNDGAHKSDSIGSYVAKVKSGGPALNFVQRLQDAFNSVLK